VPPYWRLKSIGNEPLLQPAITAAGSKLLLDKKREMIVVLEDVEMYGWRFNAIAYWRTRSSRRVYSAPLNFELRDLRVIYEDVIEVDESVEGFALDYLEPLPLKEEPRKAELLVPQAKYMPIVIYDASADEFRSFVVAFNDSGVQYVAEDLYRYYRPVAGRLERKSTVDDYTYPYPVVAPPYPSLWRRPVVVNAYGSIVEVFHRGEKHRLEVSELARLAELPINGVAELAYSIALALTRGLLATRQK
jgi:hypothetical protein